MNSQDVTQSIFLQQHNLIHARLVQLNAAINDLKCATSIKLDLLMVHTSGRKLWAQMDNEFIQCRKYGRLTARYETLMSSINEVFRAIDKEVFWQNLH